MLQSFIENILNHPADTRFPLSVKKRRMFSQWDQHLRELSQTNKLPPKLEAVDGLPFTFWLVQQGLANCALLLQNYFATSLTETNDYQINILQFAIRQGYYQGALELIDGIKEIKINPVRAIAQNNRNHLLYELLLKSSGAVENAAYLNLVSALMNMGDFPSPLNDSLFENGILLSFHHKIFNRSESEELKNVHHALKRYLPNCCELDQKFEVASRKVREMR